MPSHFALLAGHKEHDTTSFNWDYWELFNRNKLQAIPFNNYFQDEIQTLTDDQVYDLFETKIDWTKGHTMFFIGIRNSNLTPKMYLKKLRKHVELVSTSLKKYGLKGFTIIANNNYTAAYLNWETAMQMAVAYSSNDEKKY